MVRNMEKKFDSKHNNSKQKYFIENSGVYYLVYKLFTKECNVAFPGLNSPVIDLIVSNKTGIKTCSLQVKTGRNAYNKRPKNKDPYWQWQVNARKGYENVDDTFFYAFVDLNSEESNPLIFIVPSLDVACYIEFYGWIDEENKNTPCKSKILQQKLEQRIIGERPKEEIINYWNVGHFIICKNNEDKYDFEKWVESYFK